MKRRLGIDLVKVFAAVSVIAVHHFSRMGFYTKVYNGGLTMILGTGLYLISLVGVPLFLITSGYLLSKRQPDIAHYKKVFPFIFEFILIVVFGNLILQLISRDFNVFIWLKYSAKQITTPVYYVGLYFSLYLVAPFLNRLFDSLKNDKERTLFLFVVIFVISLPSTLNTIRYISFFDWRPTSIWAVMYYIIGLYLKHYQPKVKKVYCILGIAVVAISYGLLLNVLEFGGNYNHYFGYYESIFVVLTSVQIFLLIYQLDIEVKWLRNLVILLSSSTLSFYIGSAIYSDYFASKFITISGTLYKDLVITMLPFILLSLSLSIPLAAIVYIIKRKVTSISLIKS